MGSGSFTSNITGLTANITYYVRAYAINGVGTNYGPELAFTTPPTPSLTTTAIGANTTGISATSGGTISSDGGSSVSARGVCWSTSTSPTISNNKTSNGTGTGAFASSITGLTPGTTYYLRAYATNDAGTAYGSEVQFTTPAIPIVSETVEFGAITQTTAMITGRLTTNSVLPVTYGIDWSTDPFAAHPGLNQLAYTGTVDGMLTFSFEIKELSPGTTYYVCVFAFNSLGLAVSDVSSFTTE